MRWENRTMPRKKKREYVRRNLPSTPIKKRARELGMTYRKIRDATGLSTTTINKVLHLDESVLLRHLRAVAR